VICIVEAMKMENEVHAARAGIVSGLTVSPGDAVRIGQVICVVVAETASGAAAEAASGEADAAS